MPRSGSDGEDDVFFDACDDIRSPTVASLSVGCSIGEAGCGYELWASEPISVKERRHRFLEAMGFVESVSTGAALDQWHGEITTDCSSHDLEERISSTSDVDNGRRCIAHQSQHNDLTGDILEEEVGSDKTSTSNEPEVVLRFSRLVRKFFRNGFGRSRARGSTNVASSSKQYNRDRIFTQFVQQRYSSRTHEQKGVKNKLGKGRNRSLAVIPKKVFSISETPVHEFHGHTSDVLDMAWSKSDFLLTSSKDNTIRMWKVGCNAYLAVFRHGDYVTCVQFNPVDERYFISGSTDGKVHVWDVSEKRVIDWDDTRDVITAISYRPDGKGFVVGSVTGTRFYDQSGKNIELNKVMQVKKKKKSAANKVTSVQFSEDDSRIIITSADSKIRVSEGHGIIKKFGGQRSSKAMLPPSLTSDGRYLVSASMDSNVRIWDFDAKGRRPVRSCEVFFSDGVTAVAPWTRTHAGADEGGGSTSSSSRGTRTLAAHAGAPTLCQCHDRECCSFGTWFFAEGMRVSATWPEDINCAEMYDCQSKVAAAAWNMVMLTGSRVGVIRAFHNYGLPVRL
ncbi:hypothetical protein ABZP36_031814 [Zizania latifolia]